MKRHLPNIFTLSNLGCGLLAITAVFSGDFVMVAWLMAFSLIFDFLDGMTARLLRVHSELGKQLDSLADLVSFGVVPGLMMFRMFRLALQDEPATPEFLAYLAILIPIFSALRLAKFNLDTRQAEYFIGLPTPANAIFIASIALLGVYGDSETTSDILLHPFFLTAITIITSLLLIAELPLMSLKLKSITWQENRGRLFLLLGILIMLFIFRFRALLFIIPLYLLLSLIFKPNSK